MRILLLLATSELTHHMAHILIHSLLVLYTRIPLYPSDYTAPSPLANITPSLANSYDSLGMINPLAPGANYDGMPVCVHACVHVCVCVCVYMHACMCVHVVRACIHTV